MKPRIAFASLAVAFAATACDRDMPTSANNAPENRQESPSFAKQTTALLTNIPVSGTLSNATAFTGTLTITRFALDRTTGALLVSGVLRDATGTVVARFTNVVATLINPITGTCSILDLDIGEIHLDLLGLVVDLSAIHLNITGQTGPGNLLGNLLCALAGLLDGFPNTLQQILNTIANINGLLR
jgi:hypothetical protein